MASSTLVVDKIEAIFFDMNGTLRQRIPDEGWQRQSVERLLAMLETPNAPASFLDELTRRYKSYTQWADEHRTSLPESEIWNRWLVPESSRERIEPQAVEMMLAFRNRKGRNILKPDANTVIAELSRRGYRLGVISNTTSTVDLPRFIEECGLQKYFEVVILSAACGMRKPDPAIFLEAASRLQIGPVHCAYIGNKPRFDVAGPRRAGFGMALIINSNNASLEPGKDSFEKPDGIIHELRELLDIFPPRQIIDP
jgi:putative hydrolase of the HAD superfamily